MSDKIIHLTDDSFDTDVSKRTGRSSSISGQSGAVRANDRPDSG